MTRILTALILIFMLDSKASSLDGEAENKVQEEALILSDEFGEDSPELDLYLQGKELNEEDLDFYQEEGKD